MKLQDELFSFLFCIHYCSLMYYECSPMPRHKLASMLKYSSDALSSAMVDGVTDRLCLRDLCETDVYRISVTFQMLQLHN